MLKCRDIAHAASDFLDHQVSWSKCLAILFHIMMCGQCRAFLAHMRLGSQYYRELSKQQLAEETTAQEVEAVCRKISNGVE